LLRIFRVCDKDNDGYLSDQELKDFQYVVFKSVLEPLHIKGLKTVLTRECEDFDEQMAKKGITFKAFVTF